MPKWLFTNQELHPLREEDFSQAIALWDSVPGVVLRAEDRDPVAFGRFLQRNSCLSWGVWEGQKLIAAILAGHDGRRGHIYHLAVSPSRARMGLGRLMVTRVKQEMEIRGIHRLHAHVLKSNSQAWSFWLKLGWAERDDLRLLSWSASDAP